MARRYESAGRDPVHPPTGPSLRSLKSKGTEAKTLRGQLTRQKLLDAAEEVIGEKGYFEAGVVDITRKAGVSQGTFYIYFPSKLEIFRELVLGLARQLKREIAANINDARNRLEAERLGYEAFLSFVTQHRNLYKIVRQAEWVDETLYRAYYEDIAGSYVRALRRAQENDEIRDLEPETLAYSLMAVGEYLGMRWVLWQGTLPPAEVLDTVMEFVYRGIAPEGKDRGKGGEGKRQA